MPANAVLLLTVFTLPAPKPRRQVASHLRGFLLAGHSNLSRTGALLPLESQQVNLTL